MRKNYQLHIQIRKKSKSDEERNTSNSDISETNSKVDNLLQETENLKGTFERETARVKSPKEVINEQSKVNET